MKRIIPSTDNSSEREICPSQDIFILGSEPIPGMTPDDIRQIYSENKTEEMLSGAYAAVYNKVFWVEDDIYDFDENTPEYCRAVEITDSWVTLMNELESVIFDILRRRGISVPDSGTLTVLIPFMDKNGYDFCDGWWIEKQTV